MDNLIIWIFVILLLLFIIIIVLKRIFYFYNQKNKSINHFVRNINNAIRINNINISEEYEFKRSIKYEKKHIPLGKVIFDNVNNKVLIYETFIYKSNKLVCIPDIRVFSYNNLIKCNFYINNELLKKINDNFFSNKKNDVCIKLELRSCFYQYINLRLSSVNDNKLFIDLYKEFNKIIRNNKK